MKKVKKVIATLLCSLTVLPLFLPFTVHAAKPTVSFSNLSGAVYPGCTLTVAILASGNNMEGMQAEPLEYNKNQLTPVGKPETRVSGWSVKEISSRITVMPDSMLMSGVSGNNLQLLRFTFKLNDSVKIGDTIRLQIKDIKISNTNRDDWYTAEQLTYSVKVAAKPKDTNCNLNTFSCEEGAFTPAFNKNSANNSYALTVPNAVTALHLTVSPASNLSTYKITGNENFEVGENTVTVTVTAESGATRTYTLIVTRKQPPSVNALLAGLNTASGTLSPAFSSEVTEYTMTVAPGVTAIEFETTTADPNAKVLVEGAEKLNVGKNTVTVTVTAEDGISRTVYTVTVHRIDTNALLSDLSFGEFPFIPAFDKTAEEQIYSLTVPYEIANAENLKVLPESTFASFKTDAPETFEVGENRVTVTVTAEDGETTATYVIIVTRSARILSSNALLKSLTSDAGTFSPEFTPENTIYTLVTPFRTDSVAFSAIAADEAASASSVVLPLKEGMNLAEISCTAEDGSIKVYSVYVFLPVKAQVNQILLNGSPEVGQQLTAIFVGDFEKGTIAWFVGDKQVENYSSESYMLLPQDANKTVKAVFTDAEGNQTVSQVLTVTPKEISSSHKINPSEVFIIIAVIVVSLAIGAVSGFFFTKRRFSAE